jgi:iron complex outermembrane receptor protein
LNKDIHYYSGAFMSISKVQNRLKMISLLVCLIAARGWGQTPMDLTKLSLEELMSLEVTTVIKKSLKLQDVPAAVFVLSSEDINRSGYRLIPEIMRLSPGMEVASIDANKWAISARGFGDRFANKLLVLMDGRSVYISPFSGVYWDVQDYILEDIDRIEIVRGPGASLWGANAVNGVINIISKSSAQTQGGLISCGLGLRNREGFVRYGFPLNQHWHGRSYLKYHEHENRSIESVSAGDSWHSSQWGMRIDGDFQDKQITIQGDIYRGVRGRCISTIDLETFDVLLQNYSGLVWGGNLLARLKKEYSKLSELVIQAYTDYSARDAEELAQKYWTFDLDFYRRFHSGRYHELILGGEYRVTRDRLDGTQYTRIEPNHQTFQLVSSFLQDELEIIDSKMVLVAGSKFEYNSLTGFEIQPTIRAIWKGSNKHSLWAAVSRAVRTPSRVERDGNVLAVFSPAGNLSVQGDYPLFGRVLGQPDFKSETMVANELGYRFKPASYLSTDFSVFYNHYGRLRIGGIGHTYLMGTMEQPYIEQVLLLLNRMKCRSYGLEEVVEWHPSPDLRLRVFYSYIKLDFQFSEDLLLDDKVIADYTDEKSPDHQLSVWGGWRFRPSLKFDIIGHYQTANPEMDDPLNIHLSMRLFWQINKRIGMSWNAQNLWEWNKQEFKATFPGIMLHNAYSTEVPRTVFFQLNYQW